MDRCGTWKFGNYSRKNGDRNIHSTHPLSTKLAWVLQSVGGEPKKITNALTDSSKTYIVVKS